MILCTLACVVVVLVVVMDLMVSFSVTLGPCPICRPTLSLPWFTVSRHAALAAMHRPAVVCGPGS